METSFFALLFRQKYIKRWGLMRNFSEESLSEHSAQTAFLAHALAVIGNTRFGKHYNAERVALLALYHDAAEVYTGDLPTPIKYYSESMRDTYREIEKNAENMLLDHLPEDMKPAFSDVLSGADEDEHKLIKAADKLSALLKCIEERKSGNSEFLNAEKTTRESLNAYSCEELDVFMTEFLPPFESTLDEL